MEVKRLVGKLSTLKTVFSLWTSGYCAIHWLVAHNFSVDLFSSALVFGAIATMAIAWLSDRLSSSSA